MIYSAYGLINTSANWQIQPGTMITFGLDTYTNSSTHTILDEMAEEYDFDHLEANFFGEPQLKFNITAINTSVSISQLVENFLNFTAPMEYDQILNESGESKTNFLPLCVPIEMWEGFQTEFEARSISCTFFHTGTNEASYTVNWAFEDQNAIVTFYWDDQDGSLQAIFYEIGMGTERDVLILRLSGLQTPTPWANNILPYEILIGVLVIGVGAGIFFFIIRYKKKYRIAIDSLKEEKQRQIAEEGINPSSYEYDPRFMEGFSRFKNRYLIRCVFFNGISVGVFAVGVYLLDVLGNSLENWNLVTGVIFGGVILIGVNVILLNVPLIKLQKQLTEHTTPNPPTVTFSEKSLFRPYLQQNSHFGDISPMITFAACMAGFFVYYIFASLENITTIGGQLVMVLLSVLLIGVIAVAYYLFPNTMLRQVKKRALQVDYMFP
ncbi:MAG: hypothetical protein E4G98_06375 [Promethearchaeota archaeon]|nr:MAG: hypothetical protein E4G98_06375 [Candidatus Lokiarchaeota archaeon]